ncbi:MAG: hypothetical protein R3Y56_07550 [Akkermansia sp.]
MNAHQEKIIESGRKLELAMGDERVRKFAKVFLDDMRLRFDLVSSPIVLGRDGEMNQADTIRKGAAHEFHNIYARIFAIGEEMGKYQDY